MVCLSKIGEIGTVPHAGTSLADIGTSLVGSLQEVIYIESVPPVAVSAPFPVPGDPAKEEAVGF